MYQVLFYGTSIPLPQQHASSLCKKYIPVLIHTFNNYICNIHGGIIKFKQKHKHTWIRKYSKIPLLRPPNIKITSLLGLIFPSPKWYFPYDISCILYIKTISLIRPLLGSLKGNIGILLYQAQKLYKKKIL